MKIIRMVRTIRPIITISMIFLLLIPLFSFDMSLAADKPDGELPFEVIKLPPEALSQAVISVPEIIAKPGHPRLDSSLQAIVNAPDEIAQKSLVESYAMRLSDQRLQVQIRIQPGSLPRVIKTLSQSGGEVTKTSPDETLLQVWLPVPAIEQAASHPDILMIQRPPELELFEIDAGLYTTEGLSVLNGTAWHSAGYTGTGVKIGVIDGGFFGYTSLLGSDFPATITGMNFVDGETSALLNATTQHGTACVEIIYDIAPGASYYLAKINTFLDLVQAVTWLRDTVKVDVISTSFGFYNVSPGDGTGAFEDLVKSARDAGILWVTAAGNDRQVHWGGAYSNKDSDPYHEYYDGSQINFFGPGDGNGYLVPAGYPIQIFLRWDDWTYVNQDYDLYLYRYSDGSWVPVAYSTSDQTGSAGQTPTEYISIYAPVQAAYGFAVVRYSSTRNVNLEISAPRMTGLQYRLSDRSLANLADSASAMTVAALNVVSPYVIEYYSSQGPTNGLGGTAYGGLIKPNISGFANVSTVIYGTVSKFNGTSAATPHVAGAAALVLDANPYYSPAQLQAYLEGRAVDMGTLGMDSQYGYGRLYLGAPTVQPTKFNYLPLVAKEQ